MPWLAWEAGRWPLGPTGTRGNVALKNLDVVQELVDAWNASNIMPGTYPTLANPTNRQSVWAFIEDVRIAIFGASLGDPSAYNRNHRDPTTGYLYSMGDYGTLGAGHLQPFMELYAAAIEEYWRQKEDGTRTGDPDAAPLSGGVDGGIPCTFHLNELKDLIELYKWPSLPADVEHGYGLWRYADSGSQPTRADAIDVAWAAMPATQGAGNRTLLVECSYADFVPSPARIKMFDARNCYSFTPPAGCQAIKIAISVTVDDFLNNDLSPYHFPNPEWGLEVYVGTAAPSAWDYGTLAATLTAPGIISQDEALVGVATLDPAVWTPDVKNYIRLVSNGSVAVKPTYLSDFNWYGGDWAWSSLRKQTGVPQLLYRIVDE